MDYKKIAAALCAVLLAGAASACSKGGDKPADSGETSYAAESAESAASADTSEALTPVWAIDLGDCSPYVTLGKYVGVEIVKEELTDELIEEKRLSLMDSLKEYKDVGTERPAALGDIVKLDYKGYRDDTGEAFEGGEATDYSLELGSATFIPGFEDALVGHTAGESFDINLTFPDNYRDSELAGQPVKFEITLKTVNEAVYPELTDDTAKKLGFETVEELEAKAKSDAEEAVYTSNLQKAWEAAVGGSEIISYPEELYNYTVQSYVDYYVGYYTYLATMYGMELSEYVSMKEEDFRADVEENGRAYAEDYLREELVMLAVADEVFGRELSDDEYQAKLEEYADKEGVTTDELTDKYEEKSLKTNALWDKVLVYIFDNAVFVEDNASAESAADASRP